MCDTGEGIRRESLKDLIESTAPDPETFEERAPELAIVKHLARLHGGAVKVQSGLGAGTTFTIELPQYKFIKPPPV